MRHRELNNKQIAKGVISSGTAKALATIHAKNVGSGKPTKHGYILETRDVIAICKKIGESTPAELHMRYEIDLNRAEILHAGATILLALVQGLPQIPHWLVSTFGLREGLVMDTYHKAMALQKNVSEKVTGESFRKLGKRFSMRLSF